MNIRDPMSLRHPVRNKTRTRPWDSPDVNQHRYANAQTYKRTDIQKHRYLKAHGRRIDTDLLYRTRQKIGYTNIYIYIYMFIDAYINIYTYIYIHIYKYTYLC